jgi:hypothetical protein
VISVAKAMEAVVHTREAAVEAATPAKTATMKAATVVETSTPAPAVETSASATAMSVGGIWLAERRDAQQSNGNASQSPSYAGARSLFA